MYKGTSRATSYQQRIRSSTAFDLIIQSQQTTNNDSVHYTFGDDAQDHLSFNTDSFDYDSISKDFNEDYCTSNSSYCFSNDTGATEAQVETDIFNDNNNSCLTKSDENEHSIRDDEGSSGLENIE
jgi:hypothetical protein